MEIIELIITDDEIISGIDAISIVKNPAIESNFISLKKDKAKDFKFKTIDKEKRILIGPALIPDKPILRVEGQKEYYVFFSKETVRKASEIFLKMGKQSRTTLEHELSVSGCTVVESWIVEDPTRDKSVLYGMEMPEGSWLITMKIDNDKIWNDFIKTGEVRGFSVEGYFMEKLHQKGNKKKSNRSNNKENHSKNNKKMKTKKKNILQKTIKFFSKMLEEFETQTLEDGSVISYGSLEAGEPVFLVTDDGELPLPVGDYVLPDGKTLKVTDEGIIAEVVDAEAETEELKKEKKKETTEDEKKEFATKEDLEKAIVDAVPTIVDAIKSQFKADKKKAKKKAAKKQETFSTKVKRNANPENKKTEKTEPVTDLKNMSVKDRVFSMIASGEN